MKTCSLVLLFGRAAGHAQMYEPPSRSTIGLALGTPNCAGGCCLWFNNGAFIGCDTATGGTHPPAGCKIATPTLPYQDPKYGTIFGSWEDNASAEVTPLKSVGKTCDDEPHIEDVKEKNPWRYPGIAPVENPCGLNGGGYMPGPDGTGGEAFFGFKQGHKGTEVPPLLHQTTWIAGSVVEVAWGITANHGGGYQYRLCKVKNAGDNITAEATEECFQKMPLEFVGDTQWIQYGELGEDRNNRTEIPAVQINKGTWPKGSTWRKNPIPACNDFPRLGGHNHKCAGPMFTPPIPGLYGFGPGACASGVAPCTLDEMASRAFPWGLVDKVQVPADLEPGDYILSFRWDCEQLPQVWSNCADVKIAVKGSAKPTKPFSPWAGCESCCHEAQGKCANCTACVDNKEGDCAYCWNPLKGFDFGAVPKFHCLGWEESDGSPTVWKPGMPFVGKGFSPGCTKCWNTKDSCKPAARETMDDEDSEVVV